MKQMKINELLDLIAKHKQPQEITSIYMDIDGDSGWEETYFWNGIEYEEKDENTAITDNYTLKELVENLVFYIDK